MESYRDKRKKNTSYGLHSGRYPMGGHYDHLTTRQYLWASGEVGDRITAIRDDDIYKTSAHTIENLLVTNLGNLEFMKGYEETAVAVGTVMQTIETQWDFYIVVSTDGVRTVSKSDRSILHTYAMVIPDRCNVTLIDAYIFICTGDTTILEVNTDDGQMAVSNFKQSMQLPLKWREFISVDIYEVRTVDSKLTPVIVSIEDTLELEKKSDGTYIKDTDYKVSRFYIPYQTDLVSETPPNAKEGDVLVAVRPFLKSDTASFYVDNIAFNFTGKTTDASGQFYTNTDLPTGIFGKLDYGEIYYLDSKMIDVVEFQNRLWIMHGEEVFASKIADYNNFRNDILDNSPFYFKPSNIREEQPQLLRMVAGRGLYLLTDKGVYITGHNATVTPSSVNLKLATDEPATREAVSVEDTLYFLSDKSDIMVIQNVSEIAGVVDFQAFYGEKYSIKKDITTLEPARINGRRYVLANSSSGKFYLYKTIGTNEFARTSCNAISGRCIPYNDDMYTDGKYYRALESNTADGRLKINVPNLWSEKGGYYMNDLTSRLHRFVMRLLDEDDEAVETVTVNGITLNRLGQNTGGINSIYVLDTGIEFNQGMEILIKSKETEKILEIQATEMFYKVNGD